ncbi:uncharacterized protein LOC133179042 [Saccostrea echinata]|uniref:uncharacterized protein LOC133176565 n=1 Tax=Saccostrea echinata TaxID=191078 RepID=UPI002A7F6E03|nr:uncharacterized protein LOC133176565 [Saccostrea echinata]XP_061169721.1 uncharacterized protein LOC133179042 [Saccostrea echinata]
MEVSFRRRQRWRKKVQRLRRERGWDNVSDKVILFFSTINGYHHFRIMPTQFSWNHPYMMECIPEPTNRRDPLAVLVKEMGVNITIGRVPKDICNVISLEMRVTQKLRRTFCLYIGTHHNEGPVPSGGLKLHCVYVLEFSNDTSYRRLGEVASFLRRHVPSSYIYL